MNIIEQLIKMIRTESKLEERIVWGFSAERRLQLRYRRLAARLGVPVYALIGYILDEWSDQNYQTIMTNPREGEKLEEIITDKYLRK